MYTLRPDASCFGLYCGCFENRSFYAGIASVLNERKGALDKSTLGLLMRFFVVLAFVLRDHAIC